MTIEEENKQLRMGIEKLKGIIYEEQTFNEVNKKENERLRKENEEIRETLTRARFRLEEENQILRQQFEKMKCCENCLHHNEGDCQSEHFHDCKFLNVKNKNDFWEMKK